ncbi:MAG: hypothetical protein HOP04_00300 [Methylophilaceae bacterium]|nr:hypothetical protein [Methylophilaceae bacterium]
MNKCLTILFTSLLLLQANHASAIEIKGAISCSYWFSGRSKPEQRALNTTWLVGYLSAIGWKSNDIILNQTEIQSIELWTDEYCRIHPESYIANGARDLSKELLKKGVPAKY